MPLSILNARGLSKCLFDTDVPLDKLKLHITQLPPGASSHPPHTHDHLEVFFILEGTAAVEFNGERHALSANEAIVLDAQTPHGISNPGDKPLRYLVINTLR